MLCLTILVLGASFASAVVDNIGPCDVMVYTDETFNLQRFSEENNGVWLFVKVPATDNNQNLESMVLVTEPAECYGQYHTIMYYKNYGDEKYKVFTDEDVYDSLSGHVTVITRGEPSVELKVFFLKYVPGRYCYYYICNHEGGDKKVDYRYVLAHGPLTHEEEAEIQYLEDQFQFSGVLKDI